MAPNAITPSGGGLLRRKKRRAPKSRTAAPTARSAGPKRESMALEAARPAGLDRTRSTTSPGMGLMRSAGPVGEDRRVADRPLAELEATAGVDGDVRAVVLVERRNLVGAPEHLALVVQ